MSTPNTSSVRPNIPHNFIQEVSHVKQLSQNLLFRAAHIETHTNNTQQRLHEYSVQGKIIGLKITQISQTDQKALPPCHLQLAQEIQHDLAHLSTQYKDLLQEINNNHLQMQEWNTLSIALDQRLHALQPHAQSTECNAQPMSYGIQQLEANQQRSQECAQWIQLIDSQVEAINRAIKPYFTQKT